MKERWEMAKRKKGVEVMDREGVVEGSTRNVEAKSICLGLGYTHSLAHIVN